MAYEAERLIERRFGRTRARLWIKIISYLGAALFGAAVSLLVAILKRNI